MPQVFVVQVDLSTIAESAMEMATLAAKLSWL